jgi:hypothetical protein
MLDDCRDIDCTEKLLSCAFPGDRPSLLWIEFCWKGFVFKLLLDSDSLLCRVSPYGSVFMDLDVWAQFFTEPFAEPFLEWLAPLFTLLVSS